MYGEFKLGKELNSDDPNVFVIAAPKSGEGKTARSQTKEST